MDRMGCGEDGEGMHPVGREVDEGPARRLKEDMKVVEGTWRATGSLKVENSGGGPS